MSNTYTQIHLHCVFAVKNRESLIVPPWQDRLHKYIIAIINNNGHRALAVNSMPDHIHLCFGLKPDQSLSDLMRFVKADSSKWINEQRFVRGKFRWQEGYGSFGIYKPHLYRVINYIDKQQEHHKKIAFLNEYRDMLIEHEVQFDERYIFTDPLT